MASGDYEPTNYLEWEESKINSYVETPDEDEGTKAAEIAPAVGPQTAKQKLEAARQRLLKAKPVESKGVLGKKVAPKIAVLNTKPKKDRVPVEGLVSRGWRLLAQMAAPVAPPVARVLDMQAPVAGAILEDVIKGTIVDSILQPIAQVEQSGEAVWALVGPPLCIGIMSAKPELMPVLAPALKDALRTWIDIAGPKIMEQQQKEVKFQEQYGAQIDDMMAYFMGHTEYPGGPHTEEYLAMLGAQPEPPKPSNVPVRKSRRNSAATVAA